jgi:hypothetical protein
MKSFLYPNYVATLQNWLQLSDMHVIGVQGRNRTGDLPLHHTTAFAAACAFVRWTIPSPWHLWHCRREPSSLYTFKPCGLLGSGLPRRLRQGFPRIWLHPLRPFRNPAPKFIQEAVALSTELQGRCWVLLKSRSPNISPKFPMGKHPPYSPRYLSAGGDCTICRAIPKKD